MKTKTGLFSLMAAMGLMLGTMSAHAVPIVLGNGTSCGAGNAINGISTSNVTGNAGGSTECWGTYNGNDPGPSGDGFDINGTIFNFISKFDVDENMLTGANIGLSITGAGSASGTWQYDPTLFAADAFLIVLKAANSPGFAVWLFDGTDAASWNGDWSVAWTNPSGKPPALSHIGIYAGAFQVPEPGTAALLGIGLLLLGFSSRKQITGI